MELGEDSFDIGDEGEAHGYGPLDWRPDDDSTVYREAEARIKAGEGRNQVLHYMRLDSKELRRFGVQFIFFLCDAVHGISVALLSHTAQRLSWVYSLFPDEPGVQRSAPSLLTGRWRP